jgi:baseplate J-like protein
MAERDIVQNLISQLGQSQDERLPAELGAHFVDVDERDAADLLRLMRRLAPLVRYYRDTTAAAAGDWTPFFAADDAELERLARREDGAVAPHFALLAAFAQLHEIPRAAVNRLTARHLDFFYRRVLRFAPRAAVPDRAHVLIELKKGAAPVALGPGYAFSAGKDATGAELVYVPTGETVVNASRVESLRSLYRDAGRDGTVRSAPRADSADGLGAPLPAAEPRWRAFGHSALPAAEIGFAVAAPVLRLREGRRKIVLTLRLAGLEAGRHTAAALAASFQALLTGEKGWLGPYGLTASLAGDAVRLALQVPEGDAPVVDYGAAVHGGAYAAQAPVLQLLLRPGAALGLGDLERLTVRTARVEVEVDGVASLALESDAGVLDPKKAFLPFGPQPAAGSRFHVGYAEAFAKALSRLELHLQWQGAPASFHDWYAKYSRGATIDDGSFTAAVFFADGGGWKHTAQRVKLLQPRAAEATTLVFERGGAAATATAAAGGITLSLDRDFLHADYRRESVENVVKYSKAGGDLVVLNEPYTPTLRGVSLSYKAHSGEADVATPALAAFAAADVQLFHAGPFGQRREHAYLRRQLGFVTDLRVPLLPRYENEGELLLGLSGLAAGDSVSLLFQTAEGSADPDLPRQQVQWSALCDNHWRPLSRAEIVRDTTRNLLSSGVVGVVIPPEATRDNTMLPAGLLWLRAAVSRGVDAVSQLIAVAANAVEVRFEDRGNDPAHLRSPLPAGKIAKLKTPVAAVKSVKQPYASFGGEPAESDEALRTRAAERLRHRGRCLTPWDYERTVLAAFPGVHKVKVVPHARDGAWLAPGHVLVVVVPDLRNRNAVDLLQPRVDADTLARIADHLQRRAGMQVQIAVKNPRYQQVRVDFKVRFLPGYEFNFYRRQVERELIRFLTPWAFDAARPISFGGKIYKSVLLDFVEELEAVDFVTDFRMFTSTSRDIDEVQAETPDAILVSAPAHTIAEVAEAG